MQLIEHVLVPLRIGVLLGAVGVAITRLHQIGEHEVLCIGVSHVEHALVDFGVVGAAGAGAVHIVGNRLTRVAHQPCHSVGLIGGVGGVGGTRILVDDIVPVGNAFGQCSSRGAA